MSLADIITKFVTHRNVTVSRTATGTVSGGVYTPGSVSTITVDLSVQPVSERDLMVTPDEFRIADKRAVFCRTQLKGLDSTKHPDVLAFDGDNWTVYAVATWGPFATYYKALVTNAKAK